MLAKKKALVIGLMSDRSIAYGISSAMHQQGAEIGLSCLPRFTERVTKLAEPWSPWMIHPSDCSQDEEIQALADTVAQKVGKIDVLVHSIAFAPRDHLEGGVLDNITREGFLTAHDISVYSLCALVKAFLPHMNDGAAVCTLSYLGSQRAVPNYNVMGLAKASLESAVRYLAMDCGKRNIRVNAVSAGPIRTPSAAGIKDMRAMQSQVAQASAIKEPVSIEQVGNVCAFLCSPLASGVTGEVVYVDNGFHMSGGATA